MESFIRLEAVAAPLLRSNIDTDAIIPSREMKLVSKKGLGGGLFANWRYTDVAARTANPAFVLNNPHYAGAEILIGGVNFGCGSSREHAAWALREFGFRCIIAPSFGAIFRSNCIRNGIAPVVLPEDVTIALAAELEGATPPQLTVDLVAQTVITPSGARHSFSMDAASREQLLEGLDEIDVTFKQRAAIDAFEAAYRPAHPWIFRARPI
jgi:3-isopropylmalate/(R)-2-methylmalate dehydratase small subunit